MKRYEGLDLEVIRFDLDDIITDIITNSDSSGEWDDTDETE